MSAVSAPTSVAGGTTGAEGVDDDGVHNIEDIDVDKL